MANKIREIIRLKCTEGTGHYYTTTKNKRNSTEKLRMKKYNPTLRRHVMYEEGKIK